MPGDRAEHRDRVPALSGYGQLLVQEALPATLVAARQKKAGVSSRTDTNHCPQLMDCPGKKRNACGNSGSIVNVLNRIH